MIISGDSVLDVLNVAVLGAAVLRPVAARAGYAT